MGRSFLKQTAEILRTKQRRKHLKRAMVSLSVIVAMLTSYLLIMPAVTMERDPICGQEEHTHTDECYEHRLICGKTEQDGQAETTQRVLSCAFTTHVHGESCYNADGQLICGYADYAIHTHDENCYDADGNLVCTLPEVKQHGHDGSCYATETVLACGQDESSVQTIVESSDPFGDGTDVFGSGDNNVYVGDSEGGHIHTEECYETKYTLTCGKDEIIPHTHTAECYDENGNLVCGRLEIQEHQHDENCFMTVTTEAVEGHTHTDECYEDVLICDKAEHVHTEECYPQEEAEDEVAEGDAEAADENADEAVAEETGEEVAGEEATAEEDAQEDVDTVEDAEVSEEEADTAEETEAAEEEEDSDLVAMEPAVEYICGKEEHTHGEGCWDEEGNLICGMEEHVHDETCLPEADDEEAEEEPVVAKILTAEGSDYTVEVTYTDEAQIPDNAVLSVREIEQGTEEYESYYQQAVEAVQGGDTSSLAFARFFDISFVVDGTEIEPAAAVAVKISYKDAVEVPEGSEVKSVHFGEETEVLDVQTNGADGTVEEVAFDANGFSVYGIVGTEDTSKTKTYRTTYTFQNDDGTDYNFTLNNNPANSGNETPTGTSTNKQIVKDGGQLLDVGTPTSKVDSSKKFLGWGIVGSNGTVDKTNLITLPYTVSMGSATSDASIKLQAVYSTTIKITFYDVDNTTILTVVDKEPNSQLDLSKYEVVPTNAEEGFLGWNTTNNSTTVLDNMYTVPDTDISLYPVIVSGHWLRFDKNDNNDDPTEATYTSPVFVTGELTESVRPVDPTRSGYTFAGWYENEQTTDNPYSFSGTLTSSKTLYAKWTPNEVKYKVVYWQENPDDYGFSYKEGEEKTGTAGTKTSTSSIANKYTGFHLHSNTETDRTDTEHLAHVTEEAVIKGDGTTVVNVYYDRDIYTVKFVNQANATNASYSKNNDGEYYQVNNSSWSTWYLNKRRRAFNNDYYKIGEPEGSNSKVDPNDSSKVTFTYYTCDWKGTYTEHTETSNRYSRTGGSDGTIDELTITAKYGADISNLWPSRRTGLSTTYPVNWKVSSDRDSKYQANIATMPLDGFIFYYEEEKTGYIMNINYYVQSINGDKSFSLTEPGHTDSFNSDHTKWYTTKEDYYNLRGFKPIFNSSTDAKGLSEGDYELNENNKYGYASAEVGSYFNKVTTNIYEVNFYYARNMYDIGFTPNDGNNTPDITHSYYYQASIANAAPESYVKGSTTITASNGDTLTFDGWYDNPDGLGDEYDFTGKTMPANNIHLYGKWEPTTYTVTINPNGGTFPDGTADNRVNEDVVFGSTISKSDLGETSREGYDLIGWYIQKLDGTETVYDFSTPVTSDVTIIAHWRKTGSFGVKYINTDPTKTPETDGDTLKYDSNTYADLADVTVLSAPDSDMIPAGYEFTGWSYDGTLYKPGDTFTLDASKATTGTDIINVNSKDVNYVTLKAQYTKLDTTYICYNINYTGGSGTLTDPEGIIDNIQSNIPLNTTITLSSGSGFTRTGYVLVGWNTQADGNGTHWALGEKVGVDDVNGNELYAEWEPVYIQLSFTKTGEQLSGTSTGLEGAGFTLSNSTELKTVTSSSDGSVSFTGENAVKAHSTAGGSITLTETTVPEGYEAIGPFTVIYDASQASKGDDGKYYVNGTIQKDGVPVNSFEDKLIRQNLVIKKIDSETQAALSGAEFTLTYGNPATNASATSGITDGKVTIGNDGTATIIGLPVGRYTLTETKAPSGYIIKTTGITIEVTKDGVTVGSIASDKNDSGQYIVTIENAPGKALPNTGGTGALPYTLGGIALLMATALMYGFRMRHRERRLR